MGNWFHTPKQYKILILGLDNAGKSTIVHKIIGNEIQNCVPTIGFNLEEFKVDGHSLVMWDLGGQDKTRDIWGLFLSETDGLIYVIDITDQERLSKAVDVLETMLLTRTQYNKKRVLKTTPVMILLNKIDNMNDIKNKNPRNPLLTESYISDRLEKLDVLLRKDSTDRLNDYSMVGTSGKTGEGITYALISLVRAIESTEPKTKWFYFF